MSVGIWIVVCIISLITAIIWLWWAIRISGKVKTLSFMMKLQKYDKKPILDMTNFICSENKDIKNDNVESFYTVTHNYAKSKYHNMDKTMLISHLVQDEDEHFIMQLIELLQEMKG